MFYLTGGRYLRMNKIPWQKDKADFIDKANEKEYNMGNGQQLEDIVWSGWTIQAGATIATFSRMLNMSCHVDDAPFHTDSNGNVDRQKTYELWSELIQEEDFTAGNTMKQKWMGSWSNAYVGVERSKYWVTHQPADTNEGNVVFANIPAFHQIHRDAVAMYELRKREYVLFKP